MIYFLLYLFVEVYVSTFVSSSIGGLYMFLEIVGSAFIGIFILSNFKYSFAQSMRDLYGGEITHDEFVKSNIFSVLGAILIIVPGIFTDILGLLLQVELFAIYFANTVLKGRLKHRTKSYHNTSQSKDTRDSNIIDVEVIE